MKTANPRELDVALCVRGFKEDDAQGDLPSPIGGSSRGTDHTEEETGNTH